MITTEMLWALHADKHPLAALQIIKNTKEWRLVYFRPKRLHRYYQTDKDQVYIFRHMFMDGPIPLSVYDEDLMQLIANEINKTIKREETQNGRRSRTKLCGGC